MIRTILRKLLLKALDAIDSGECDNITPEEIEEISGIIHSPKTMGRECAAKYIGVSLNRFHELKNLGIIKEPRKVRGMKEKMYYLIDLEKSKKQIYGEKISD